jgi:putative transposase
MLGFVWEVPMTILGIKFKAYPTPQQASTLSQWIGCARIIYNSKVEEDLQNYKLYKENGEKNSVHQAYSHFKTEERPWLNDCPSQILRNSASNWYTAKQRFFKGLSENPKKKKKGVRDTILLTREVFSLQDHLESDGSLSKKLIVGTKTNTIGSLKFKAHREFGNPNQIVVGKKNENWYVSFCYETGDRTKTEQELLDDFASLDQKSLNDITIGIDRGVAIPFQASNESKFDFDENAKTKIKKNTSRLKRLQKKLSRQEKKSKSRNKTRKKISKIHTKISNIRHDFCHKVSHEFIKSEARIFVVEDLKLKNMTKAPQPKQDENGKYLPNKKAAKAGLNRELLSKGLGKTIEFLEYKAIKNNKLVIKVPPQYTSQECASCGHIHPDNRKTQSDFLCLLCGNHDNADLNAAKVIAKRGVEKILSAPKAKIKTRLGISRSKAGRGIRKTKSEQSGTLIPMTPEAPLL